jgi:diketogulonate reductase-like aldo/keto reductase
VTKVPSLKLNNGVSIPALGLGTWKLADGPEAASAVKWALEAGYRHIDTAAIYGNEESVGKAIAASGVPREEIFVTTKLWNSDQPRPREAFNASLKRLGLDYIDLYLIHWPSPESHFGAWKELEKIYGEGKCRAIGVSNFSIGHLDGLLAQCKVVPAVNQVEFSPFLYQKELLEFCRGKGMQLEAYSPLTRGKRLGDNRVEAIAKKHGKSNAQVLIRWSLQHGNVVIPKSANKERIAENFAVFDFELLPSEMAALDALDEGYRIVPVP